MRCEEMGLHVCVASAIPAYDDVRGMEKDAFGVNKWVMAMVVIIHD